MLDRGRRLVAIAVAALAACDSRVEEHPLPPDRFESPITAPSVAQCGECHMEVFREWDRSLHRWAWLNRNIQQATRNFTMVECRPCHSPEPVAFTGLDTIPRFRPHLVEDGVHCLSCHGLPDGRVAAARDVPEAPCRPVRTPWLWTHMACYPCHQPTHNANAEFLESAAYRRGWSCQDCHMPRVERRRPDGTVREGRSHGPHGGLEPEQVRAGVDIEVEVRAGWVAVRLANLTGHKFPGEIPSRALHVVVRPQGGEEQRIVLRKPFKGEEGWSDNRLRPDEVRELEFDVAAGTAEVLVLWYPYPPALDPQPLELHRTSVSVP